MSLLYVFRGFCKLDTKPQHPLRTILRPQTPSLDIALQHCKVHKKDRKTPCYHVFVSRLPPSQPQPTTPPEHVVGNIVGRGIGCGIRPAVSGTRSNQYTRFNSETCLIFRMFMDQFGTAFQAHSYFEGLLLWRSQRGSQASRFRTFNVRRRRRVIDRCYLILNRQLKVLNYEPNYVCMIVSLSLSLHTFST